VAGADAAAYADVHVEPTDVSFREAARVAREIAADGYASLGGGATESDAGVVLAGRLIEIMRGVLIPNGLSGVGYVEGDLEALTDAAVRA